MIKALDHIAIAVSDIEVAIRRFADDFGIELEGTEDVVPAKTKTAFFPIPGTRIELVHPLNGEGAIQRYLERQGRGGLHHIAFETDDIHVDHASGAASAASEKAARSAAAIRPGNRCATGYLLGSNLAILLRTAVSCSAARLLLSVLAL